jgi:DNA-binding LytR/AlgR family response regulator
LLREELALLLQSAWPALDVVAQARNGREAVEHFEALKPDVCFLDVHMPGLSGVDAARAIGRRAQLVFVTAFDDYAVAAFEHGALDYLVKPVHAARLAETVARVQERLRFAAKPVGDTDALLLQLSQQLQQLKQHSAAGRGSEPLRYVRASVGTQVRLIAVHDIDYLRSDSKYTLVAWRDESGVAAEALVVTPLKELIAQLDASSFVQVHRSVVVNLAAVSHVTRGLNDTADIHLKGRPERLPVSRSYLHLFRQM